jgi:hypothetical protein
MAGPEDESMTGFSRSSFGLKISCRLFQVGAQQECGHAGATHAAREFKGVVRDADNCFSLPSLTAN